MLQTDPVQSAGVARKREETEMPCAMPAELPSLRTLLGQEAKSFAKRLEVKLAGKWQKPCSQARGCGCVKARLVSMAAVCATPLCLHGSRVLVHQISTRFSQWEDGVGLAMHEWT